MTWALPAPAPKGHRVNPAKMRNKLHRRARHALAGVACAAVGLSLACANGPAAEAETAVDRVQPGAGTADKLRRGEFRSFLLLTGELQAVHGEKIIVPRLPRWQTTIRWMVDDGAAVAEGDRLVELDTAEIAGELDSKVTSQEQAINQLDSKRAEITGQVAQKEFAVAQTRVALQKAEIDAGVPEDLQNRKEYQEIQLRFAQAQVAYDKAAADLEGYRRSSAAEIEIARIEIARTEREVREARQAIATMVLRAPRAGIAVTSENRREGRKFQVGDTISVGSRVMEIPDLSKMMVAAGLSDVDDGKIAVGMPAVCTLDAYPEREFPCAVVSVSPVAQEASFRSLRRYFSVRVDLEENDPQIMRPGMSVKVAVRTQQRADAMLAARSALTFTDEGVLLRLANGDMTEVTIGPCNALECVIEQDTSAGTGPEIDR